MKKVIFLLFCLSGTLAFANSQPPAQFDTMFRDFFEQMKHLADEFKSLDKDDFFDQQSWLRYDEKNKQYVIHISTNNLEKNQINITTKAHLLTVTGMSEQNDTTDNGSTQHYRSNSFQQSFTLPKDADIQNIQANQESDVLIITVPRLIDESVTVRKIEIN